MSSERHNVECIFPLTPMQEGILFYSMEEGNKEKYCEQIVVQIKGVIDIDVCRKSLEIVSVEHEMLRSAIVYHNVSDHRQLVLANRRVGLEEVFLDENEDIEKQIDIIKKQDVQKGFDLEKDVLMRVTLVHINDSESIMLWSFHHIIIDGWCISIILKDFMEFYEKMARGISSFEELMSEAELAPKGTYMKYVKWVRNKEKNSSEAIDYWKTLLCDYESDVRIHYSFVGGTAEVNSLKSSVKEIVIDSNITDKLQALANKNHVTMSAVIETVWGMILQKYTYNEDVVFGKVISGRNVPIRNVENVVGLFINTIPVRMTGDKSFSKMLVSMGEQGVRSLEYGYSNLANIIAETNQRNLIQSIVAFENYYSDDSSMNRDDALLKINIADTYEETNYSLNLVVGQSDVLKLKLLYLNQDYSESFVENMLVQMKKLLEDICENPDKLLSEYELLSEDDKNKIFSVFNDTTTEYPRETSLKDIFEEIVIENSDKIAIASGKDVYSYSEANKKANRIANYLISNGLQKEDCVAVMGTKNEDMLFAILGILKAGGVYVPIDSKYPQQRIDYMLKDCGCRFIVTNREADIDKYSEYETVSLESSSFEDCSEENPQIERTSLQAAYIIYTSGSTGEPKGVVVTDRNIVRLVKNTNFVNFEDICTLQLGAIAFDASTFEIWAPLLNGGKLCMYPYEDIMNLPLLSKTIEECGVNTMWLTAQLFNEIVDEDIHTLDSLKQLLIGGEKLSEEHVNRFLEETESVRLFNGYGPTENTTFSTVYEIECPMTNIPIGKPISNSTAYVVNNNKLCGVGMLGELWVGGDGLAREYLNQQELTSEKFVQAPWALDVRLYRTGDFACWREDGVVEYLGRIDKQVKIRGFRIEPEEIEHVIQQFEYVNRCVVEPIAEGNNLYLCAYIVAKDSDEDCISKLKVDASKVLPEYMIPSAFVMMDRIPTTVNGKVDKRALPKPTDISVDEKSFVEAETETEKIILEIFKTVLEREKISAIDNFFEVGGHSLRASRVINMLEKKSGIRIPLRDFFANPSVKGLARLIDDANNCDYDAIAVAEKKEFYPVSSVQRRIFVFNQMLGENVVYNMHGGFEIHGEFDVERMQMAYAKIIRDNEILRTGFELDNNVIVQKVFEQVESEVKVIDANGGDLDKIMEEFVQPFDLSCPPLLRMTIVRREENDYVLLFDIHHIISDGRSMNILVEELLSNYAGGNNEPKKLNYKDYCVWLENTDMEQHKEYWVNEFKDEVPVLEMHTDFPRKQVQSFSGASEKLSIDPETAEEIKKYCVQNGVTESMFMLSAIMVLISKYANQEDLTIGMPIAGRNHADTMNMIGMFVNTLPLRGRPEKSKSFKAFLGEMRGKILSSMEHSDYSIDELGEVLNLKTDMARNSLFDITFAFQNNEEVVLNTEEFKVNSLSKKEVSAKFDITVEVYPTKDGYDLNFEYCSDLYQKQTVYNMIRHFVALMKNAINMPDCNIGEMETLSQELSRRVLEDFNQTDWSIGEYSNIVSLFEEQVESNPQRTAVSLMDNSYTYSELDRKSNGLAKLLSERGIGKDSFVGLFMDKSIDVVLAIVAILKTGAAYIPMDVTNPESRIEYIIKDSTMQCVITNVDDVTAIGDVTCIDIRNEDIEELGDKPEVEIDPMDVAYVIYTSGTTGLPKGVMVRHLGVQNLAVFFRDEYKYTNKDVVLQFANLCFDASVFEIMSSLLNGCELTIITKDTIGDSKLFREYITDKKVSVMLLPPQYAKRVDCSGVRLLITGGSEADREVVLRANEKDQFMNAYGPTEATVLITHWPYDVRKEIPIRIPIGKPIYNSKIYVMNGNNLCGIRMPGELCVSGICLSAGYVNNENLTNEKFVTNPYSGDVMYRTGDLVCWNEEGELEYLGRIDEQVKVRGYRIELLEIEKVIQDSKLTDQVVVVTKKDSSGQNIICAYYTGQEEVDTKVFQHEIGKRLPAYMIPSFFCHLDEIPYNASGKVAKSSLPEPNIIGEEFVEPSSETQKMIAAAYMQVLKLERVGATDNFFMLGGNSLNAMMLVNSIEEASGVRLPLKILFENSTVEALANYLETMSTREVVHFEKVEERDYYPLSAAQKRIYLISQIENVGTLYNMPSAITIHGQIDEQKIRDTFVEMIQANEPLRTIFKVIDGEPVQVILDNAQMDFAVDKVDVLEGNTDTLYREFVKPFELSEAPLFRIKLVKTKDDNENLLMFDMHHIIGDGFSMNVFIREFMNRYVGNEVPEKAIQYKDYAVWSTKVDLSAQREYWLNEYKDLNSPLDLVPDFNRPSVSHFTGDNIWGSVSNDIKAKVQDICNENGLTEFMVLFSAYVVLLSKYSRQSDIVVGTPITGRVTKETEDMLGIFINTLPIRFNVDNNENCVQLWARMKDKCLSAFEAQEYPMEDLISELDIPRESSRNPLFDVMFALQNNENITLEVPGISAEYYSSSVGTAKFDITMNVVGSEDGYKLNFEYSTELFEQRTIQRMLDHYVEILKSMVSNPEEKINTVSMLSEEEYNKVTREFNQTEKDYPTELNAGRIFELQAAKNPDEKAIIHRDRWINYRELNCKVNQIAHKLVDAGVEKGDTVALICDKSIELIMAILAIVKIGAVYVPIYTGYPKERIKFILEDSAPKVVFSDSDEKIEGIEAKQWNIFSEEIYDANTEDINAQFSSDELIYILYTSGTTGLPKGAMVTHKGVMRTVINNNYISLDSNTIIPLAGEVSFDASTLEIWGAMLNGGSLVILDRDLLLNVQNFKNEISKNKVNIMFMTVALFNQFVIDDPECFNTLDRLIIGGERLSDEHVRKFFERNTNTVLYNGYGPTENTVFTTTYLIPRDFKKMYIGKPLDNTRIYILDGDNICGIGVCGELCAAGDGLATGYLKRDELTEKVFCKNLLGESCVYRTGDLARWTEDGNIEFLGRIDEQVKLNGFRIELGEIEQVILGYPNADIDGTVVTVQTDSHGNRMLVGYYTCDQDVDTEDLVKYVKTKLPTYMVPKVFMKLDEIKRTKNGKADKRALPFIEVDSELEYREAVTEQEIILVEAFKQVLGLEKVNLNEEFFRLGGDSIKSIRIVSMVREKGYIITVKDIMESQSLNDIVDRMVKNDADPLAQYQKEIVGEVKLTPIQRKFIEEIENRNHFNQSFMLEVDMEEDTLREALEIVVKHHDMLRAVYTDDSLEILPYERDRFYELSVFDFTNSSNLNDQISKACDNIQRSFNISTAPLIKVAIIRTKDKAYLFLCAHHFVVDGVSWRIIAEDIQTVYQQLVKEEVPQLPAKTMPFMAWSEQLVKYSDSFRMKREKEYWHKFAQKASTIPATAVIPGKDYVSVAKSCIVSQERTSTIIEQILPKYHISMDVVLVTALGRAFQSYTNSKNMLIDMESYGRSGYENEQLDRTVGWFTCIYPFVVDETCGNIESDLIKVKENMARVPNKGIGYGILKYILKDDKLSSIKSPVAFNYLGEVDNEKNDEYKGFASFDQGRVSAEENKAWNPLTVNCSLEAGNVNVDFLWDEAYFNREDIDAISERMLEEIGEICDTLQAGEKRIYTASDYKELSWSTESFNKVYELLDGNIQAIYPMNGMKEGMLYESIQEGSSAYVVQNVVEVNSEFDPAICKECMNLLMIHYSSLRTSYMYKAVEIPRMIIKKEQNADYSYYDISDMEIKEQENTFLEIKRKDVERGFDFEEDSMMRVTVLKFGEKKYKMIWSFHHIIMDGWCISILLNSFSEYYAAIKSGASIDDLRANAEIAEKGCYGDYIDWIQNQDVDEAYTYWHDLLCDFEQKNEIPSTVVGDREVEDTAEAYRFSISKELTEKVDQVALNSSVTASTVFEAVWGTILGYYSNCETVVYGKVVSGREFPVPHIEDMLDLFINTIPVKLNLEGCDSKALLKQIQTQANESSQYDYCTLSEIQAQSGAGRDIIGSIYIFENYFVDTEKLENNDSDLDIKFADLREDTNFPITVTISRTDTYQVEFLYDTSIYDSKKMLSLEESFVQVLQSICNEPSREIANIAVLPESEKDSAINLGRGICKGYHSEYVNYINLFRNVVEKYSDKKAVICKEKELTYQELDEKSDILAGYLVEKGIEKEERVVITGNKHVNVVVAMLAILKVGGVYVPIDEKVPNERKEYIIEDSGARFVLVSNGIDAELAEKVQEVIDITDELLYQPKDYPALPEILGENLAYTIYTSGSTGKPKGVLVEHRNMLNLEPMCIYGYKMNAEDTILQYASIAFDQAVWDIFGTLAIGATICMVERDIIGDMDYFVDYVNSQNVSVAALTPTLLAELEPERFKSLRIVESGGEAANLNTLRKYSQYMTVYNAYGPTEATVNATLWTYDPSCEKVSIGYPLPNTDIFIMNHERLCGINVVGEICIGGKGVARGYLNREELSAEKFIDNPFVPGEKLYRSGDLGRMNSDGTIDYIGRNDDQVKIRGYRIEIGEIEKLAEQYPDVKSVAVVVYGDGKEDKYLCGYYSSAQPVDHNEYIDWLKVRLPEYMVPSVWVYVETMPMTVNGKVNKKALPKPNLDEFKSSLKYVAPRNNSEQKLADIWKVTLRLEEVGVLDNFFSLGGHSLNAIRIINRIENEFGKKISIKDVFEYNTIEKMAAFVDAGTTTSMLPEIVPVGEKEYYKASYAQKRFYLLYKLNRETTAYSMLLSLTAKGTFDVDRCRNAFAKLIDRHEILRTSLIMKDEEILQKVHTENLLDTFTFYDLVGVDNADERLEEVMEQINSPFQLEEAPLARMSVVKLQESEWELHINLHHSVADGMSSDILVNDFIKLYFDMPMEPISIQYKDYSEWQQGPEMTEILSKQENYWLEKFAGEIPVLDLPLDFTRPLEKDFEGALYSKVISQELYEQVAEYARSQNVTTFTIMLAVYMEMLHRFSRQSEVFVGIPVAGRDKQELENMAGVCVNTVVIRSENDETRCFDSYVQSMQTELNQSYENQDYPFEEIVNKVVKNRNMSRNPIFDVMFTYENHLNKEEIEFDDIVFAEKTIELQIAKFDLTLHVKEAEHGFVCCWEYAKSLFRETSVEAFAETYITLLTECINRHEQQLDVVENVSEEARGMILRDELPAQRKTNTVCELFDIASQKCPDNTALVFGEERITYREFRERVNRFASYLSDKGIGKGSYVGILSEYSIEVMIGIYAALKTGAAYVPINLKYPKERIEYILTNSKCDAVLTGAEVSNLIPDGMPTIDLSVEKTLGENQNIIMSYPEKESVAYVIYTSGTTGKPKGTMISHGALSNYLIWGAKQYFEEDTFTAMPLYSSIGFDLTVTTIFIPLITGNAVHIYNCEYESDAIHEIAQNPEIGIIKLTPAHLAVLNQEREYCKSIKKFILGGEELLKNVADETIERYGKETKIFNEYGPTEATVGCMNYVYEASSAITKSAVPIGVPIDGTKLYIFDENKLCGVNMPGELCIAGYGLAEGYLNNPDMTDKRFVMNPYRNTERIYHTGDLARLCADGSFEYLGRIDEQIKIRGFRIELGEIESVMLQCEGILSAAVVGRNRNSELYLCAYYVVDNMYKEQWNEMILRSHIREMLPEYMVPSVMMEVDEIRLTANGKADKKALPEPKETDFRTAEYVAPYTETQKTLEKIWEEVLGIADIGIDDNFFEIGGHSLKATRLALLIEQKMGIVVSLKTLFINTSIRKLAAYIDESGVGNSEREMIPNAQEQEYYIASPTQRRMYLVHQMSASGDAYNMPFIFEITGDVDLEQLKGSIARVINRHEILRTSLELVEGDVVQKIHNNVDMDEYFAFLDLSENNPVGEIERLRKEFFVGFDIDSMPLIKFQLVKISDDKYELDINMHHVIGDGRSINILIGDLSTYYIGEEPEELRIQYKDYSEWCASDVMKNKMEKQRKYWHKQFEGNIPQMDIPTDFVRPAEMDFKGQQLICNMDKELSEKVKEYAKEQNASEFMILITAFMCMLAKYSRQEDVVVGVPVEARRNIDLVNQLGMYVNTIALRGNIDSKLSFNEILGVMKGNILEAFDNQEYPFDDLVEEVLTDRTMSRSPIFDIMFVLQNNATERINDDGLQLKTLVPDTTSVKYDLTLNMGDTPDGYTMVWEYATSLFRENRIELMNSHYVNLLQKMLLLPNASVEELDMLDTKERELVTHTFNNTADEVVNETTIEIFEKRVEETPEAVAVVFEDKEITYKELNAKANMLARYLLAKGLKDEELVGLTGEKNVNSIIAIIAIMKAGGAYVPFDIEYPEQRKQKIQSLCNMTKVICTDVGEERTGELSCMEGCQIIRLAEEEWLIGDDSNLNLEIASTHLAYSIFTSGSTGEPKGVLVEHKGLANLQRMFKKTYEHGEDRILQFANLTFDASVCEIFITLLNGKRLYIVEKLRSDIYSLEEYIAKNKITLAIFPTTYLKEINPSRINSGMTIISAGSEAPIALMSKLSREGIRCFNAYGPTEATVHVSEYEYKASNNLETSRVPIGKPIINTEFYVMNHNTLCSIGETGELCIAGIGLARGYINQNATEEKFVKHPLDEKRKVYRTGDLVRWLPSGNIEFIGRIDHQVKIRGFRIEIGEVETALENTGCFAASAVKTIKDKQGNDTLCAFYTLENEQDKNDVLITARTMLRKEIPEYMIPAIFIKLDEMPVNQSGKIDKNKLCVEDVEQYLEIEYIAPRDELEELLCKLCAEVLNIDKYGINYNFFRMGGDSIKAIRLIAKIKNLGYDVTMHDFMMYPEIMSFKNYVTIMEAKSDTEEECAENTESEEEKLLSVINVGKIIDMNKISHKVERTYYELPLQNMFYMAPNPIISMEERIDEVYGLEDVLSAIRRMIRDNEVLRYAATDSIVTVYEKSNSWNIPIYEYGKNGYMSASEFGDMYRKYYTYEKFLNNSFMAKFAVHIGKNGRLTVFLLVHHMIWDAMSSEIFYDLFHKYISDKSYASDENSNYSRYVDELMENRTKKNALLLMRYGQTRRLIKDIIKFTKRMSNKEQMKHVMFSIKIDDVKIREYCAEHPLDTILYILKHTVFKDENIEKLPMLLMYHGRNGLYSNYLDTLGLFLDMVPLSTKLTDKFTDLKVNGDVEEMLKLRNKEHIHFMTMFHSWDSRNADKETVKQESAQEKEEKGLSVINLDLVPCINYLGISDVGNEEKEFFEIKESQNNHMYTIDFKGEYLYCSMSCFESMIDTIQDEFRKCINKIAEEMEENIENYI